MVGASCRLALWDLSAPVRACCEPRASSAVFSASAAVVCLASMSNAALYYGALISAKQRPADEAGDVQVSSASEAVASPPVVETKEDSPLAFSWTMWFDDKPPKGMSAGMWDSFWPCLTRCRRGL